jgi:hypothetical protein
MNISTLAKLTLLGLVYIYTIKLIDTLFHGIFEHVSLAVTVVVLTILAGLAQLLFFIAFHRQFVPADKMSLKTAAYLAIIGSTLGLLPKLLLLLVLFQQQQFSFLIRHAAPINALSPWLAAVCLLVFSLIFCFNSRFRHTRFGFAAGVLGWFVIASAQSLVVINYLTSGSLVWLNGIVSAGPIVFVTASTVTLVCLCIFFMAFVRLRTENMTNL